MWQAAIGYLAFHKGTLAVIAQFPCTKCLLPTLSSSKQAEMAVTSSKINLIYRLTYNQYKNFKKKNYKGK